MTAAKLEGRGGVGCPAWKTPNMIWNEAQNKPSLIVRDLSQYVPPDVVYDSLLRRGVFKWLSVRRRLITLKNTWLDRLKAADAEFLVSTSYRRAYLKGYRQAIRECRAEVRALCHSDRWQAPDIDRDAQRWLAKQATP